jgi:hypothetical protein
MDAETMGRNGCYFYTSTLWVLSFCIPLVGIALTLCHIVTKLGVLKICLIFEIIIRCWWRTWVMFLFVCALTCY